jgi:hypothetical protein
MRDMQLIMENWRNFSNDVEKKSTDLLLETKFGSFKLDVLNEELSLNRISREEYIKILAESIENDLKFINEGILTKAVGALKGIKDAVVNKINEMGIKVLQLAIKGAGAVFGLIQKVFSLVEKFKQNYPTLYSIVALVVKVAFWAAIAYLVYNSMVGTAKADVVYSDYGEKVRLTSDSQAMLNLLHNKAAMHKMGVDLSPQMVEKLDAFIRSKKTFDVSDMTEFNNMFTAMHEHLKSDAVLKSPEVLDRMGSLIDATQATAEQSAQYLQEAAKFAGRETVAAIHSKAELLAALKKAGYTGEVDAQHLKDIVTALLKKKHVTGDPSQYKTAFFSLMNNIRAFVK